MLDKDNYAQHLIRNNVCDPFKSSSHFKEIVKF